MVIQLVSLVVLSRLLDVRSYGLIAAVMAIIGVGDVLRDLGLSAASIQARTLSAAQRDKLFWINLAIGGLLSVATFLAAPMIADFYGQPDLEMVARGLSVTFVLNAAASQYRAGLTRDFRFGRLAAADVGSQALALVAAIAVATWTPTFWALIIQQVLAAAVMLVAVGVLARWIPRWPSRRDSVRPLLSFGATLTVTQLIGYASRNVDSVIIGSRFGPVALGVYSRGFQLLSLPLNQINGPATLVALPYLSRLRDDPPRFAQFLLRSQSALLHVLVSIFAFSVAFADPLVDVVLGPQWGASAEVFRVLAIGGPFQAAGYVTYWVFLANGLTRSNLIYSLTCRVGLIGLLFGGAHWGVLGIAWAYTVGTMAMWPIGLLWIRGVSNAPAARMFRAVLMLVVSYAAAAAIAVAATSLLPLHSAWLVLFSGTVFMAGALVLVAAVWTPYREDVGRVAGYARSMARGPRRAS